MTKNEKSKKGRTAKRITIGALLLCSLGTGLTSLAKYIKEYNGSDKTANIAQLGITVTPSEGNVFKKSYTDSGNTILGYKTGVSSPSELVGPGASGTTPTFTVVDSDDRNVPVQITSYLRITYSSNFKFLKDVSANDDYYTPIRIIDDTSASTVLDAPFFDSDNNVIGINKYLKDNSVSNVICEEDNGKCTVEIKGSSTTYDLETPCNITDGFGYLWEWVFELSDNEDQKNSANEADTKLCTSAGATIEITSLLVVEQVIA